MRAVIKLPGQRLHEELVNAGQEGGEGFSRAGWRGDQRVLPRPDRRPGLSLNVRGNADGGLKPVSNEGMEACQRHSIDAMAASALSQDLQWAMMIIVLRIIERQNQRHSALEQGGRFVWCPYRETKKPFGTVLRS